MKEVLIQMLKIKIFFPLTKKNVKELKHQISKSLKYNPLKQESTSTFFKK